MIPHDLERLVVWWGPGMLLLMLFSYGFLRLAHYWIEKSMEVKRQQLDSAFGIVRQYIEQFLGTQKSQADALTRVATTVEQRESVESFEHQEMLIALKALHRDLDSLACRGSEFHHRAGCRAPGAPGSSICWSGLPARTPASRI